MLKWIVSSSMRAAISALRNALRESFPSSKKRCVNATQPIRRLSAKIGEKFRPRMHSVLPPPMSTTRRLPAISGSSCETPR